MTSHIVDSEIWEEGSQNGCRHKVKVRVSNNRRRDIIAVAVYEWHGGCQNKSKKYDIYPLATLIYPFEGIYPYIPIYPFETLTLTLWRHPF